MNTSKIDVLALAAEEASARMNWKQFEEAQKGDGVSLNSTLASNARKLIENAQKTAPLPVKYSLEESSPIKYRPNSAFQAVQSSPKPQVPLVSTPTKIDTKAPPSALASPNLKQKPTFVDKLHMVLADRECNSVISWLPSGKSFAVLDKKKFAKTVLPKYFKEAKFDSFYRRVKRWGFRTAYANGNEQVVFTHDLFIKDRIDMCAMMSGREWANGCKDTKAQSIQADELALAERSIRGPVASPANSPPRQHVHVRPPQVPKIGSFPKDQARCVHPQAVAKYSPHVTTAAPVLQPRPHAISISEGRVVSQDLVGEIYALDKEIGNLEEQVNMLRRLRYLERKHLFQS